MARIAAVLRLVLLLLAAAIGSAAADTLSLPGLDGDARAYANVLTAKSPPTLNQKLVDEALAAASQALAASSGLSPASARLPSAIHVSILAGSVSGRALASFCSKTRAPAESPSSFATSARALVASTFPGFSFNTPS